MIIKELLNLSAQIIQNKKDDAVLLDEKSGLMLIKSSSCTELTATFYKLVPYVVDESCQHIENI